jgi:hypothetical protein
MNDQSARIAAPTHQASETHHTVLLVWLDRELDREYALTNPGPPGHSGTRAELPGIAYPRTP